MDGEYPFLEVTKPDGMQYTIELDSGEPQFLKTVKGRGYSLDIKIIE